MFRKTITQLFILIIVLSCIFIANGLILAWTSPGSVPPDGNVDAPINVGSSSQYKEGALGIEGIFRGYSNAIFDGSVGIGTATPSSGLKLDVDGAVGATEYCDENGENCVESGGLEGGEGGSKKYVGATTVSYNAVGIGGYDGGDAKCVVKFGVGARMCAGADFANGRPTTTGWYNSFYADNWWSEHHYSDCAGWTSPHATYLGARWDANLNKPATNSCTTPIPILCCE